MKEEVSKDPIVNESPSQEAPSPSETKDDTSDIDAMLGFDSSDYEEKEESQVNVETPKEEAKESVKEEVKPQEEQKPIEAPQPVQAEPSRLDRRIAKLYNEVSLLNGEDSYETQAIIDQIKNFSKEDKKQALNNLLAQKSQLRGQDSYQMAEEDTEALIEAEAEERLQQMQAEVYRREWDDDLVKTFEAHPELDEKHKDFNPSFTQAVEKLASSGMKVSEAYNFVKESIDNAVKEAKSQAMKDKQKALSGTVNISPQVGEAPQQKSKEDQIIDEMIGDFS